MFNDNYELSQKILETKKSAMNLSLEHWYNYELFTWQWWIKFIYLIIPIIIFFKFLDRRRSFEILTYGLMISLISTVIDVIGVNFIWWDYPIRLLPSGFYQIHDLVFIPIISMLLFQHYSSWKSFAIANLILAAAGAYIWEPISMWLNYYKPFSWKHTYSFIVFFMMTVFCKYIIEKLKINYQKTLT